MLRSLPSAIDDALDALYEPNAVLSQFIGSASKCDIFVLLFSFYCLLLLSFSFLLFLSSLFFPILFLIYFFVSLSSLFLPFLYFPLIYFVSLVSFLKFSLVCRAFA